MLGSFTPASAAKAMRAVSPESCGKRAASRSEACCVSVPGRLNVFWNGAPKACHSTSSTTSTPTQPPATANRCFATKEPQRSGPLPPAVDRLLIVAPPQLLGLPAGRRPRWHALLLRLRLRRPRHRQPRDPRRLVRRYTQRPQHELGQIHPRFRAEAAIQPAV